MKQKTKFNKELELNIKEASPQRLQNNLILSTRNKQISPILEFDKNNDDIEFDKKSFELNFEEIKKSNGHKKR